MMRIFDNDCYTINSSSVCSDAYYDNVINVTNQMYNTVTEYDNWINRVCEEIIILKGRIDFLETQIEDLVTRICSNE